MRGIVMSRLIIWLIALAMPLSAFGAEQMVLKYARFQSFDEKGTGLRQPEGLACSEDRLVVADTGNKRLVLYALQGGEILGGTEIKIPQLPYPVRVAIGSKGDIFIIDGRLRKVAHLSREGKYVGYVEPSDLPAQSMVVPAGLAIDSSDNLYLMDIAGGRVLVLSPDGKFQRQINFPKEYGFMTDITVDPRGTVFAVDGVKSMVYSNAKDPAVLSPISGTLKEDLKFPSNIIMNNKGMLLISDQNGGGIVAVSQDGTLLTRMLNLGWTEGTVRYPSQLCTDRDGAVFVADRENNRIQEFTPLK
jgi:sugar lactone lactonase YvrE